VVAGDTWGTFVAYSNALANNSPDSRILENYLSQFDDPNKEEPDRMDDEEEEKAKRTELLDRIEEKLTETVSSLTEQAENKQKELTDTLKELSRDVAQLQAAQMHQTQLLDEHISKLASITIKKADEIHEQLEMTKQPKDGLNDLAVNVTRLQVTQERQTLFLYLVIGLLAWLLVKMS
jgi:hypothetical protein